MDARVILAAAQPGADFGQRQGFVVFG